MQLTKMISIINKTKSFTRGIYDATFVACCLLLTTQISFADGIIPISSNDQTRSGSDFAETLIHICQKAIIPLIMLLGAVGIIWIGISTMIGGIKESQEKQKFDPLKNAIVVTVVAVVVGGALLYLLERLRTYTFS